MKLKDIEVDFSFTDGDCIERLEIICSLYKSSILPIN